MQVTVQVLGHLQEFFPSLCKPTAIQVDDGATVEDVLRRAGIPAELPGSVLCGGQRVTVASHPQHGDLLLVLSPLAGG